MTRIPVPASGPAAPVDSAAATSDVVVRLGDAIGERVAMVRRAEERLASFAFIEATARVDHGASPPGVEAHGGDGATDWRYFTLQALRAIADPWTASLLDALPPDGLTIDEVAARLREDRLVVRDRVAALASAGLVSRALESDRVRITTLGAALLETVAAVAATAAARDTRGGPR